MRVLLLSSGLSARFGGSAISEASLCAALRSRVELRLACRQDRFDDEFADVFGLTNDHSFKPWEMSLALFWPRHRLNRCLDGVDIVHINGHWRIENCALALLAKRRGIPYVLHPRGMFLVGHRKVWLKKWFNRLLGNRFARGAARVIALSRYEVRQFRPYGLPAERVVVVPNGIPVPKDVTPTSTAASYFLYFGRLEARKNLLFLLEAFARYRRRGGTCELWLVGPVERGYDAEIRERCLRLQLGDSVRLKEPVYDAAKWGLLAAAKAVVYPTLDEPFGRVPFEAVAAGAFPVVPNDSGSAEYLKQHLPFCIYRHQDDASLASVLEELGKMEKGNASLARAREWVAQELDWTRLAETMTKLYREAAGGSVGAAPAPEGTVAAS